GRLPPSRNGAALYNRRAGARPRNAYATGDARRFKYARVQGASRESRRHTRPGIAIGAQTCCAPIARHNLLPLTDGSHRYAVMQEFTRGRRFKGAMPRMLQSILIQRLVQDAIM